MSRMEKEKKHKPQIWLTAMMALSLLNGCGGQLYRVAAPPKVAAPVLTDEAKGFVTAARLLTSDELMEQFDANLLLAGVLVVDIRAANRSEAAQSAVFALRDAAGTTLKPLLPKQALQQVMKFYGNRLYAKAAYQHTLGQYETLALPLNLTLSAQAEKRGFLYFATTADATTLRGLQLTTEGLAPSSIINLN